MNVLNQRRLIELRLGRGIPVRQLARDCGIEIAVLNRLEATEHPSLTNISLSAIIRLANYLGVPVGDLFTDKDDPTTDQAIDDATADTAESIEDDAAHLGAVLITFKTDVAVIAIADATGWDLPRVHHTATHLANQLHHLGMTVYKNGGLISLRPRNDEHSDTETKVRRHPRASPYQRILTPARARIIYRAAQQPISPHSISNSDRVNIATLLKAGALVEDERRHFVPAPEVIASIYAMNSDHDAASADDPSEIDRHVAAQPPRDPN